MCRRSYRHIQLLSHTIQAGLCYSKRKVFNLSFAVTYESSTAEVRDIESFGGFECRWMKNKKMKDGAFACACDTCLEGL